VRGARDRVHAVLPLDFGKVTANDVVTAIAARLGATPAQVGLAWLLAHAPNCS
jgi:diketogulonate reductase-like aldo/keto reductase